MRIPDNVSTVLSPLRLAGAALALAAVISPPTSAAAFPDEFRMRVGDVSGCGEIDLDDTGWESLPFHEVPQVDSPICLRTTLVLTPDPERGNRPLGVRIAALAASEVWWDGELLGGAGAVGSSAETEIPGPVDTTHVIPEHLARPGPHTLALRVSAFHRHFRPQTGFWTIFVADYGAILAGDGRQARGAIFALSGILMAGLFSLMLYAIDRRDRSFLFLALLCLTAAALSIAESWRPLFGYTYDWHLLRLVVVTALALLLDLLLLVFLARRFPMSHARWFVGLGSLCAIVPVVALRSWDPKVLVGFLGVFSLSLAWTLRAVVQRQGGGLMAFVGLLPAIGMLLASRRGFVEGNLYIAINVLLLCLFASHVIQVRRVRREREEAQLKSARLELEMVRRHIQPHFLMNTLTALAEWVEREPRVAANMIQSLSEEFRLLSDIADREVIPVEEEIRLCRCHLEIMSHRKGNQFAMTTEGVDPTSTIPPAVFHTLVENAITHNHYRDTAVEFRLSATRDGDDIRYVFEAPLGERRRGTDPAPEGTGLRYIRTRLREAFGQGWSLDSAAEGDHWRTEIVVPATS